MADGALALGPVVVSLLAVALAPDLLIQLIDGALGALQLLLQLAEALLQQELLAAALELGEEAGVVGAGSRILFSAAFGCIK